MASIVTFCTSASALKGFFKVLPMLLSANGVPVPAGIYSYAISSSNVCQADEITFGMGDSTWRFLLSLRLTYSISNVGPSCQNHEFKQDCIRPIAHAKIAVLRCFQTAKP